MTQPKMGEPLPEPSDIPLREHLDRQIEDARRAIEQALDFAGAPVPLREHIEAVLQEYQRALTLAEGEREKTAEALREQLSDRIAATDGNLREHISSQIAQLTAMVDHAETLALSRHESLQREMKIQHAADQAAIAKAESANESRFAAANEWRGQSADRERTQQEQIASFVATLTPLAKSEAIEDKLAAATDRNKEDIEKLTRRFDVREGQSSGVRMTTGVIVTVVGVVAAALGIIIVLANVFTGSG